MNVVKLEKENNINFLDIFYKTHWQAEVRNFLNEFWQLNPGALNIGVYFHDTSISIEAESGGIIEDILKIRLHGFSRKGRILALKFIYGSLLYLQINYQNKVIYFCNVEVRNRLWGKFKYSNEEFEKVMERYINLLSYWPKDENIVNKKLLKLYK